MARIRTIKPQAFTSRTLSKATVAARWTFAGLWTYADDHGRAEDDPRIIKGAIWPQDDDVTHHDVAGHLDELAKLGLICRYSVDGKDYFHVVNWFEHQPIPRRGQPRHPECPKPTHPPTPPPPSLHRSATHCDAVDPSATQPHDSAGSRKKEEGTGKGNREQGRGSGGNPTPRPDSDPAGVGAQAADTTPPPDDEGQAVDAEIIDPVDDPVDRDAERLCQLLVDRIHAWSGERKRITNRWRTDARALLTRDGPGGAGYTAEQIEYLITWATDDPFWRANILSIPTLRKQRLQLIGQIQRDRNGHRATTGRGGRGDAHERARQASIDELLNGGAGPG